MTSTIAYRDPITGAPRTETARFVNITAEVVVLRSRDGLKYTRPLDLVDTIDGQPID